MSFYRKYRPQTIEELDNPQVAQQLLDLAKKKHSDLPHAYLFCGPKGSGKTTTARLIAKMLNCPKPAKNGGPCGVCDMCRSIADNRNLDILEIDAASNRGIDEIRELKNNINLSPAQSKVKVYIIDEVHMLTTEAFNALLKTLEEPPAHAVFVLATTDPQKVPATIQSRCVVVQFGRAGDTELKHSLERIVKKEKLKIDSDALESIVASADGSFRDGAKLLEQASFHDGPITLGAVQKLLSISSKRSKETFLSHLVSRDMAGGLADINTLVNDGKDIRSFIVDCLNDLEKLLISSVKREPVDPWNTDLIKDAVRRLCLAYSQIKVSPIAALPLELAVIDFCQTEPSNISKTQTVNEVSAKAKDVKPPVTPGAEPKDEKFSVSTGALTVEKLTEYWNDFIVALKPYNHSVAGVLRSSRPKEVKDGVVTIEAFYKFHQEKLSETKTLEMLAQVFHQLFGEKVKVDVVLGKK